MKNSIDKLAIVIPCYNEEGRMSFLERGLINFVHQYKGQLEILLVNDGSEDLTIDGLRGISETLESDDVKVEVLDLPKNMGKGNALKQGVLGSHMPWVLTCDADMATKPTEIFNWVSLVKGFKDNTVYIGSRVHRNSNVEAKWYRKYIGAMYNLVTRSFTPVSEKDTQCGFKLYPSTAAKKSFGALKTLGWAHDIEVLSRCKLMGFEIHSLPVNWEHKEGAKINVIKDGFNMLIETIKIGRLLRNERTENE